MTEVVLDLMIITSYYEMNSMLSFPHIARTALRTNSIGKNTMTNQKIRQRNKRSDLGFEDSMEFEINNEIALVFISKGVRITRNCRLYSPECECGCDSIYPNPGDRFA